MRTFSHIFLLFFLLFTVAQTQAQTPSNPQLVHALDSILVLDQSMREGLDSMQKKYVWQDPEMRAYWAEIGRQDSLNQRFVFPLLDTRGWPSVTEIGAQGSYTLFWVVQHSHVDAQEKYLPIMQRAAQKGDLKRSKLAMLEDRINMNNGRFQLYGTQFTQDNITNELVVWPLQDPDGVAERRREVGLSTIEESAASLNLKWNLAEYKKQLPALKKKWLYATPPDAR